HQNTARSSSSSISSQLIRSNSGSGNNSSYSTRQRSQSPSSSPAMSSFGGFSRSLTTMKNSKYDYHHDSSNRLTSRSYRYEPEDIDDMGEDSHLSSSSKRDS